MEPPRARPARAGQGRPAVRLGFRQAPGDREHGTASGVDLGAFAVVKRHYAVVMRVGGGLLVVVGLLLVSGLWGSVIADLRGWVSGFETAV